MRSFIAVVTSALALLSVVDASVLSKRQTNVVPEHGTTLQPANGTVVAPGQSFPFSYQLMNYCFITYVPVEVYLSTSPPTAADVSRAGLVDGSYIYSFGGFEAPANGLPPLPPSGPQPPPSSFTMPTLDVPADTTLYLTVVETDDCPWHQGYTGFETTTVVYG
ncbi:hypothetical protein K466DRAFT_655725 [Polyporus arcularius HHB13444]|uniref:Ubiquitin 3 binding protein But2 C-terminal domain-containing protein n=2 Tax=Polyporaceae TaxID=5317 RepID=A0A5C3P2B6_9APHY|nr:hypothetical protein OH76DRAFT_1131382 [Polyporus brumalis]TFK82440.1 hypothetical protein K466DRAFT_655725 [Polyporus arcularius HHB13444]